MDTDPKPRNPFIVGLGVAGSITGSLALILALVAASEAARLNDPLSDAGVGLDPAAVVALFAWADILGFISVVTIVGALVIAGVRWMPRVAPVGTSRPRLDGELEPPGGLTPGERRLLVE
jgi:hypothetical protein